MSFSDFHGNSAVVRQLREMLSRGRFPHAILLSGPEGAGKYTLALMLARAMNCPHAVEGDGLPDYCGVCDACSRIGQSEDLAARFAESVEARESMREADKRETRILVQTHPDVLVVPPDPPQMMVKVDQVRRVIQTLQFKPAEVRRRVVIFTGSAMMKEAVNSLLKILEEPPEFAVLFLLARNPGDLLPTIRSRCLSFTLSPLPAGEIEQYLEQKRPEWSPHQRRLVAQLSGGAVGRAQGFDLEAYVASRKDALTLLDTALRAADHSALFRATETYRSGAEGKEKTDRLLAAMYSILEDLLAMISGVPDLVRNTDITGELKPLAASLDFAWVARAAQQLGQLQSAMRRNVLRSLSLDALALSLEK